MASIATSLSMRKIRALTPPQVWKECAGDLSPSERSVLSSGKLRTIASTMLLKIFVRRPSRQGKRIEATSQLHIAIDRLPRLRDAEAHKRQLQFVAQIAQRVENDARLSSRQVFTLRERCADLV